MNFRNVDEAARALEATMVKELLKSSGAFRGTSTAGSNLNADLFMDVLAEAVTKGKGLGIGELVAKSLDPKGKPGTASPEHGAASPPDLRTLFPGNGLPLEKLPPGFAPRAPAPAPTHPDHDHPKAQPASPAVSSSFGERIHPMS